MQKLALTQLTAFRELFSMVVLFGEFTRVHWVGPAWAMPPPQLLFYCGRANCQAKPFWLMNHDGLDAVNSDRTGHPARRPGTCGPSGCRQHAPA
jgi:hypothetical protein